LIAIAFGRVVGAADAFKVSGGFAARGAAGLPVTGFSTTDAPPEASKPEPAATHRVGNGHATPFNAPVPAKPWMVCPLEMAPVTGLSGTTCPLDGSPLSFPTARHRETEEQATALNFADRDEMV
jgi:hypothetical protein